LLTFLDGGEGPISAIVHDHVLRVHIHTQDEPLATRAAFQVDLPLHTLISQETKKTILLQDIQPYHLSLDALVADIKYEMTGKLDIEKDTIEMGWLSAFIRKKVTLNFATPITSQPSFVYMVHMLLRELKDERKTLHMHMYSLKLQVSRFGREVSNLLYDIDSDIEMIEEDRTRDLKDEVSSVS